MIVRAGSIASIGLRLALLLSVVLSFWVSPSGAASSLGYDAAGRLASIAGPGANASYTYDAAGNRATMTAGGKTTTYTYDAAERLASVSRPDLGTFGFTYNPDGQLTTLTRPNGVTSTNTYDGAGRLTGLTYKNSGGTTIAAYTYTLDAAGNRTSATSAAGTEHYTIDPAGRLTGVTYTDGTSVSFTYDAAGNRISMTAGGSTTPYTYDAAGQLKTAGSTDYTYDAAGNRLTAGSSSFTYDDFGNLASQTSGATTIAYQTNGSGLRVSATSGSTTSAYTWDAAAALPSLLSDGTADYLSADTTLLAETSASANAYPLTDALGSVRAQTDGTGTVTASASYGVYGDVRSTSGSIGSLGYTGALSDSSGLVYLQARSLDPTTGTFTSRDSLTPGGRGVTGYNPYAYAAQNPTTYTDPSGRFAAENAAIQSTTEKDIAPAEGAEAAIEAPIEGMAEDMTVEIGDEPFAADAAADPEPLAPEPETGNPLEAPRATESGPPENLSYDVGASDGGPGEWTESIERGPTDAVDFQERVTGAPRTGDAIREYEVQGVKFDGIKDPRTMLDAKNWRSWPFPEGYSPSSILQEASRQAEVCRANGLTVEWHVSGQEAANGLSQLIERRGLGDVVKVLWHPWP